MAKFSSGQTSKQGDPVPQLPACLCSLKINEPAAAAGLAPADVSLTAPGNPRGPTINGKFHCADQLHHYDTDHTCCRVRNPGGLSQFQSPDFRFFFDNLLEENESKRLRFLKASPAEVDRNFTCCLALVVFPQAGQQL